MNILIILLAFTLSAFGRRLENVGPVDQSPSNRRIEIQRKLGINVFNPDAYLNPYVYEGNRTSSKVADKIKELKPKYARFDLKWSYIEKTEGIFDQAEVAKFDRLIKQLNRDGIEPVAILYEPPCWAVYSYDCQSLRNPRRRFVNEPAPSQWSNNQIQNYRQNWFRVLTPDREMWKRYVRFVTNRWAKPVPGRTPYPNGRIKYFEPVNEAESKYAMLSWQGMWPETLILQGESTQTNFWPGIEPLVELLRTSATIIHSDSEAKIVGPTFASPPTFSGPLFEDWKSKLGLALRELSPKTEREKAECKRKNVTTEQQCEWLDVISFHLYSSINMNCRTSFLDNDVKRIIQEKSYFGKAEIWITEIGITEPQGAASASTNCSPHPFRINSVSKQRHPNVSLGIPNFEQITNPTNDILKAAHLIDIVGDYSVIPSWVDALFLYSSVDQEYGLFKNLDPAHTRVDSTKSFESIKRLRNSATVYSCNSEKVCVMKQPKSSPIRIRNLAN